MRSMRIMRVFLYIFLFLAFCPNPASAYYCPSQSDHGADTGLYHHYYCPVSFSLCRGGPRDTDYDLRHESRIDRFYREFVQDREREQLNSPTH